MIMFFPARNVYHTYFTEFDSDKIYFASDFSRLRDRQVSAFRNNSNEFPLRNKTNSLLKC